MTSEVHTYIKHKNCLSFRLHQNLGLFSHLKWYVKHTLATGPVVHCGRCFCEREVCACLCSATDKITETINICLTVLRNNKKAVKRRFQLKQVPKFSSASELKNFIVTDRSSVSFCTKIQILIFNPKTDISFFFTKIQKRSLIQMIHNVPTEVDSLDHIQNQILWKGFVTTDPKRMNIASGNSKKFL